jgi:hypothetical protein
MILVEARCIPKLLLRGIEGKALVAPKLMSAISVGHGSQQAV